MQRYRNRTSTCMFSCKFPDYFQNTFLIAHLEACFWTQRDLKRFISLISYVLQLNLTPNFGNYSKCHFHHFRHFHHYYQGLLECNVLWKRKTLKIRIKMVVFEKNWQTSCLSWDYNGLFIVSKRLCYLYLLLLRYFRTSN